MSEEQIPIEAVLGTILQMTQYMQQATNYEAAKILHQAGYCKQYIDNCPVCAEEAGEEEWIIK